PRRGEDRLEAGAGDGERLERDAGDVVERLGAGERLPAADAGGAHALRLLVGADVPHEVRPDPPPGAVLRHLLEEVHVGVEEEGEAPAEAARIEAAGEQTADV